MRRSSQPVAFGCSPTASTDESSYLKMVTGFISPTSFIGHTTATDETSRHRSFFHETAHYQQLISTPLGLHVAMLDWVAVIWIFKALQTEAKEGRSRLEIPLTFSESIKSETTSLTEAVAFALTVKKMYLPWLFDNGELDMENHDEVETTLSGILFMIKNFGTQLGIKNKKWLTKGETQHLLQPPYLPLFSNSIRITGRDILENSATAATPPPADLADITHDPERMVSGLSDHYPHAYTALLQLLAELCKKDIFVPGFFMGCIALFDLASFGSLIPSAIGFGDINGKWSDLHPAWRFTRLYEEISKTREKTTAELFSGNEERCGKECDELCRRISWPTWSDVVASVGGRELEKLMPPFSWIAKEFAAAIRFRKKHHNLFTPPIVSAQTALYDALHEYDPTTGESLDSFIKKKIRKGMVHRRFVPPLWMEGGQATAPGASKPEVREYAKLWYYMTHFIDRLVLSESLTYPLDLLPRDRVNTLFFDTSGFKPEQVFKFDPSKSRSKEVRRE